MQQQLKFVIWFPIVLVAAFAAGYLFWQKTLIPGPYDLEPMSIVRNSGGNFSQTADWNTYNNDFLSISFKYPKNWKVNIDPRFIDSKTGDAMDEARNGRVYNSLVINLQSPDLRDLPISIIHTLLDWDSQSLHEKEFLVCQPPVNCLTNSNGIRYSRAINNLGDKGFEIIAYIPTSKYILAAYPNINVQNSINLEKPTGKTMEMLGIFDQILSTFKFIK